MFCHSQLYLERDEIPPDPWSVSRFYVIIKMVKNNIIDILIPSKNLCDLCNTTFSHLNSRLSLSTCIHQEWMFSYLNTSCWIWNFNFDLNASEPSAPIVPTGRAFWAVRDLSIWNGLLRRDYGTDIYIWPSRDFVQGPVSLAESFLDTHPR